MKTQNDLKHTQILSLIVEHVAYSFERNLPIIYLLIQRMFIYWHIHILHHDDQWNNQPVNPLRTLQPFPNIFKRCNCEDRMSRTSDSNFRFFTFYMIYG